MTLVAGLVAVAVGCSKHESPEKPATPVRVEEVREHSGGEVVRYSASIEANQQVELAFKVGGYVQQIRQVRGADGRTRNLQEGDWVSQGTVLAQLRMDDFTAKVAQARSQFESAQASLEKARLDFERASNLFASQSLTKSDYDAAKAQFDSAPARVDGARATLSEAQIGMGDASLRAPFPGLILKREVEIGTLASPGTRAFTLADVSVVKAVIGVPDVVVATMKPGASLVVTTEAVPGADFHGRITRVSPAADPKSRVFEVEVTIPNLKNVLKVGMIASLPTGEPGPSQHFPVVPLAGVVRAKTGKDEYAVFVVGSEKGKLSAHMRPVKLGEAYGNTVAVLEGVQVGERVVTTGATLLNDGDAVVLIP
jgi:multidrug efflux system membrane fusion protein